MTSDLYRLKEEYAKRAHRLNDSDIYSPNNPAYLFMIQQRQREVLALLRHHGFTPFNGHRILEIGCGRGGVLQEYLSYGADPERLHGTDLLLDRISEAHTRLPHLSLSCADAQNLPYQTGAFDLVLQYTAFSSILDDKVKANMATEMMRVVKPDGMILWYDFWLNPANKQTRGILPKEIRLLFSGCTYEFHRVTLAPPLARRLVQASWLLCSLLENLKVFNTHYLVAIRQERRNQRSS
jgi:ubiquinone/menaquinone biosynthesis C-methylase UbiE